MILIVYQKSWYVQGECVAEGGLVKSPRRMLSITSPTDIQLQGFESNPWHNPWWLLREAKRQIKMLNLLVLECGNLPNEWNWLHKMPRLSFRFKSGLQTYPDPSARSYNGFKGQHMECHMAAILQKQVKINRRSGQHKNFANRIRENLKSWSTKIISKHLHVRI